MTIANAVSLSRILIAPLFAYAFMHGVRATASPGWLWCALAALFLIVASDMLDGRIARRRHEVTDFGKLFDPLSDSLCNQIIFISMVMGRIIPLWMLLIILYREMVLIIIRFVCLRASIVVAARPSGKLKTFLQGAGIFCVVGLCLAGTYHPAWPPLYIGGRHAGYWIMLLPVAVSVLSMVDYLAAYRKVLVPAMNVHRDRP